MSLRSVSITLLLSFCLLVTGCAPRGETRTLEELLKIAKSRYGAISNVADTEAKSSLQQLEKLLQSLETASNSGQIVRSESEEMVKLLSTLVDQSGYTSRPAFGEIISQYEHLASSSAKGSPTVKLLVTRTYSLLARELETTKFQL